MKKRKNLLHTQFGKMLVTKGELYMIELDLGIQQLFPITAPLAISSLLSLYKYNKNENN